MNVRLQYSMPFTAGVYWEDRMIMNNYVARAYMVTNCSDNVSQNTAFERMKYFVYNELNSTIFVNQAHQDICQQFVSAGFKITTLPAEPVDQLIGIMLYCKLNAVMEDHMIINEMEISSDLGENMVYLHAADESLGPFEVAGWWHDANVTHCDLGLFDSDKIVAIQRAASWRDLDLAWPDSEIVKETDNTVVFAEFKKDDPK